MHPINMWLGGNVTLSDVRMLVCASGMLQALPRDSKQEPCPALAFLMLVLLTLCAASGMRHFFGAANALDVHNDPRHPSNRSTVSGVAWIHLACNQHACIARKQPEPSLLLPCVGF